MSGERYCVTSDLERLPRVDRPRRCLERFRDELGRWVPKHYASCVDPDTCRGCVPRSAEHGYLCASCWAKVNDALGRVEGLITHLRSVEKAPQALGERVDTSATIRLVIPDSWLAADGLMEALGAPPIPSTATIDETFRLAADAVSEWADVDGIVGTREGAKRAVVLVRRVQTCLTRWPDSEAEFRPVPFLLCPGVCRQRSLYRRAPLEYMDELLCQCSTEGCGWWMPWEEFSRIYSPIFEGMLKAQEKADRAARAEKRRGAA